MYIYVYIYIFIAPAQALLRTCTAFFKQLEAVFKAYI